VVTFDADPTNHKFLERYYSTPSAKVSNTTVIMFCLLFQNLNI
jgi:hypothetical protein